MRSILLTSILVGFKDERGYKSVSPKVGPNRTARGSLKNNTDYEDNKNRGNNSYPTVQNIIIGQNIHLV